MFPRAWSLARVTLVVLALLWPNTAISAEPPASFNADVVPTLTKAGCNIGGCHGKAEGQNGFKLSLFGFEPADDYEYIVKEARGRRVFAAAPAQSLLLLKGTGAVPHAGGKRLDPKSDAYELLRRWVAEGARPSPASDPALDRIEVRPGSTILARGGKVQATVVAHFRDGSTRDVTKLTVLEAGPPEILAVDASGLVVAKQKSGSATVTARYRDAVAVARVTVPFGTSVTNLPPTKTVVDELVFKQLKELGLPPSVMCDDATFIRRATIDICGRLPTPDEATAFVTDKSPDKVEKLIDRLLASPEYADYAANKWSALLRNRRNAPNEDGKPNAAFHAWVRDSFKDNKPFDQFVRELLTSAGPVDENPRAVWYRELKEPANLAEDVAQLFLGQRVACAKCHHHPHDRWTQADYWGLAAAFARTDVQLATPVKKGDPKKNIPDTPGKPLAVALKAGPAMMPHPRTGAKLPPAGLDGKSFVLADDADPRDALAEWVTSLDNPYFARTLANRYWKHFFGRGLVDPEDDLRATNPASNPELLDALAKRVVTDKFDVKKLVRLICTSNVYRLSSTPNEYNADDRQHFARFYPRRLNAEVLLDAIDAVTLAKSQFRGVPGGTRAVQLPDNQSDSYFLSVFGRPDGASACECERASDANLAQALLLMNSEELLAKIGTPLPEPKRDPKAKPPANAGPKTSAGERLAKLVADKRPHAEKLRELYVVALSREPSADEMTTLTAHIEKKGDDRAAYADILWALVNTKEFLFNH
ncbi:MAG: DUF1553 domain-containing protein [Planctomycetes bacterium]|nr:DUF1553 domain-containing protein [Planctomycetota bacterium]